MSTKPTVGRTVHYVSHGSPVQPDGSQRYLPACRAAIVTDALPVTWEERDSAEMPAVSLCVLNPTGMFFDTAVPYDVEESMTGGTWHWPERADG